MFSASGINLTTLIKRYSPQIIPADPDYLFRLEAATSRLEDLAVANTNDFREAHAAHRGSTASSGTKDSKEPTPQFNTGVFAPEATRGSSVVEPPPVVEEEKPPVVIDYEKIIKENLDPWVTKSAKIDQVVGEQVQHLGL
jgi:hypothetical protein